MTTKIITRSAICLLMCVMTVTLITCAGSEFSPAKNSNGEIQKGKEFLIKEEKVAARYIINICKRAKWLLYDKDEYPLDGGNYSWYIYLPLNKEEAPPGICVYISPRGGSFAHVDRLKDIMDKRNLIYIASRDSSNFVPTEHRMALTLRAIDIVKEKYKINEKRVYVCGDSGGGRISSLVAPLFPEIIKGAIYSIGCDFWDTIGPYYWPGFLSNDPNVKADFLNIKKLKKNRFVFLTGDFDGNMEETKVNYKAYLQGGIKNCAYIQVKDMGHSYPSFEYWLVAFAYLDGKDLKDAIDEYEKMVNVSFKENSGKKAKWMQESDFTSLSLTPYKKYILSKEDKEKLLSSWNGLLEIPDLSVTLLLRFEMTEDGEFAGFLDSPDQGVFGLPVSDIEMEDGNVTIKVRNVQVEFKGKMTGDEIVGEFKQGPPSFPLTLKKRKI